VPTLPADSVALSPGDRLRLVRRADWRFLIGQPRLGRVICLGEPDDELVAALSEVSRDVAVELPSSGTASCDVLVLVRPTSAELALAPGLLAPGGWVYVETARFSRGRPDAIRDVFSCIRKLEQLGLENVEAHWHFPSFAFCLEIVPLADPDAISLALRRRRRRIDTRLKVVATRLAVRLGALARVIPAASVIASRPLSTAHDDSR
jgi:hypothetical protein